MESHCLQGCFIYVTGLSGVGSVTVCLLSFQIEKIIFGIILGEQQAYSEMQFTSFLAHCSTLHCCSSVGTWAHTDLVPLGHVGANS